MTNNIPVLSIVTICFENPIELDQTLSSLSVLMNSPNVQFVVIDGSKTNECKKVWSEFSGKIDVLHESDRGKYHAMNKGTLMCAGKYVLFLNSGDILFKNIDTKKLICFLNSCCGSNLVYGKVAYRVGENVYIKKSPSAFFHRPRKGMLPPHQATFYPSAFVKANPYNESYIVSADSEVTLAAINSIKFEYLDCVISTFSIGGVSNCHGSLRQAFDHWQEVVKSRGRRKILMLPLLVKMFIKRFIMMVLGFENYYNFMFSIKFWEYKKKR